jgi:hypothetical protein
MLRRAIGAGFAVGLGLLALCTGARADQGLELGGRIGYGFPFGDLQAEPADSGAALKHTVRGVAPLWLDLGYRLIPELMLGAYLQTGFGFLGHELADACDASDADCSIFDLRLGIQLQYHPLPDEQLDPWVGAGFGYEWLTQSRRDAAADVTITHRGWEFLNLQAGLDFSPRAGVGVGPFASWSFARFDTTTISSSNDAISLDIDEPALHHWLVVGVRGTFVL